MSQYIHDLIQEGEHQKLDFKFRVDDSKKIARSLSAFANTDGGKLLLGVRDNGAIAGVRSDEEIYMIETAAQLYCKPEVLFEISYHSINGKSIMEIQIPVSDQRPHLAPDHKGKWKAYVRHNDENLVAHPVLYKAWKKEREDQDVLITYSQPEEFLLKYLRYQEQLSLEAFANSAGINKAKAIDILSDFYLAGLIEISYTPNGCVFQWNEAFNNNETSEL